MLGLVLKDQLIEHLETLIEIKLSLEKLSNSPEALSDKSLKRSSSGQLRALRRGERTNTQVRLDDASHFAGLVIKNVMESLECLPAGE